MPIGSAGTTKSLLPGRTIHYVDARSLASQFRRIFIEQIYAFNPGPEESVLVIDGGANIGLATLYFKEVMPYARVLAIEPDPVIVSMLRRNVEHLPDVRVINQALWDQDCDLPFWSEGSDSGRIDWPLGATSTTRGLMLSTLIDGPVSLLKLDIEGAEARVLTNAGHSLRTVARIFVEYHSFIGQRQVLGELLSILSDEGFRYQVQEESLRVVRPFYDPPRDHLGVDLQLNIWAVREESS